jgi:membrane protease YdiL (CAAX protease family)
MAGKAGGPAQGAISEGNGLPRGEWTAIHVVWGAFALIGLSLVEISIVALFDPDLESLAATLVSQFLLAATLILLALGFATMPGVGLAHPRVLGLRLPPATSLLRALGRIALWALAAFALYLAFAAIYAPLVQPEQEDIARELGFDQGTFGTIASGVLIVAVAPVAEEAFFRGFMFAGLRRRWPFLPAALLSGAVFGLFHFTGSDSAGVVPQLAVLGVILAWLYQRTGSLWPCVLVHMVNNAIAFALTATI